jgi:preprotein translocase subunit SecD
MLQILAQTKFFASGNKFSGFDATALGGKSYVGRGQFRVADAIGAAKRGKVSKEASRRQTIAERKANESANGGQN